jgi:hypothetical protein
MLQTEGQIHNDNEITITKSISAITITVRIRIRITSKMTITRISTLKRSPLHSLPLNN